MRHVGIPVGSRNETRKVLEEVAESQLNDEEYDASGDHLGRIAKLNREMPEAKVVYVAMQAGVGFTETAVLVNQFRAEKSEDNEPISWTAVKNFIHSSKCMRVTKRGTKKSGKIDTRYEGKIVGDSPEMCRALDSHGFADLKAAILSYVSYTSVYAIEDPRRFNLGTPEAVFSCIERAFSVAPTSKRIVEDILALPMVLDRIIENEGCVVPDEALRHGRRLQNHWESAKPQHGPLKYKPQSFQRIETLVSSVPPHPDVEPARAMMKSSLEAIRF